MTTSVKEAQEAAATAEHQVAEAETALASGTRSISAAALHKLRDTWRHADLTARGAAQRAAQERRDARIKGLEAIGAEVDRLASAGHAEKLADALRDVAAACERARGLAEAHDADVADLVAAAADLGAEPPAPAGPRSTSAHVAVIGSTIVHRHVTVTAVGDRLRTALAHAVNGDAATAAAVIQGVVQTRQPSRPDHLFRNRHGVLFPVTGVLNAGMRSQIRAGDLTELSPRDINLYMEGQLA